MFLVQRLRLDGKEKKQNEISVWSEAAGVAKMTVEISSGMSSQKTTKIFEILIFLDLIKSEKQISRFFRETVVIVSLFLRESQKSPKSS